MISHDPSLVILSLTIAILGAFTASVLTSGLLSLNPSEARLRLIMATLSLGGSVWATHFVGLLAITLPVNFGLNPALVAASAFAALVSTAVALFLVGYTGLAAPRFPAAVIIFGVGLWATHYFGLGAIAGGGLTLSWFLAVMALVVCLQFAGFALWFLLKRRGVTRTLLGAMIFGCALTATHYMAVASAPDLETALLAVPPDAAALSERYLAWSATIMMYLICSICLCIFVIMQFREEIQ